MNTQKTIEHIINPVRLMRVNDFRNIAETLYPEDIGTNGGIDGATLHLISRFELLASQPLERKHFVCDVEKPQCYEVVRAELAVPSRSQYDLCVDYDNAQSDLIFDGFEQIQTGNNSIYEVQYGHFSIKVQGGITSLSYDGKRFAIIENATIEEIIRAVSKYNETATNKIELKFTEAFIKKIIQ